MRKLIFTLIILLAGYVGYMYFFGKGDDKAKAEIIVQETKSLGKAVGDFLSTQKEKYDEGEFDNLIDIVGAMLDKLKSSDQQTSKEVKDNLKDLQDELRQIDTDKLSEENRKALEQIIGEVEKNLSK